MFNLESESEIWNQSLNLKSKSEIWIWNLNLKSEFSIWNLNLKSESEIWIWNLIWDLNLRSKLKSESEIWIWNRNWNLNLKSEIWIWNLKSEIWIWTDPFEIRNPNLKSESQMWISNLKSESELWNLNWNLKSKLESESEIWIWTRFVWNSFPLQNDETEKTYYIWDANSELPLLLLQLRILYISCQLNLNWNSLIYILIDYEHVFIYQIHLCEVSMTKYHCEVPVVTW